MSRGKLFYFSLIILTGMFIEIPLTGQVSKNVKVWEETITIPTYKMDPPEKSPMFFRNQSYQGASRVIYPYPAQDNLTNEKVDQVYKALFLENEYLKVCVLPEIGGRLFYATDKTNDYEIFYRQSVIKPALIGMTGAWISGGIEFCVFHHHRASTHLPVDHRITENEDGSCTIWIGEYEPRHRMKWTIGISLYPGKSYLEVAGTLMNTTENVNSFLYWANVATHANDDYQIIFPPSVDVAVYHAKNSFTHWPVTTTSYTGKDFYLEGVDASWWKNHPEPNSFFAHNIEEGFLAGYDHGKDVGTMHVGNHHIVSGAKLWEWGPGARGSMWDSEVLTDTDGPYAELMAGAYSDNQPDYSWIKPYETKTFHQYWYPLRDTKGAKNANLKATVNLEMVNNGEIFFAANTTNSYENANIILEYKDDILFSEEISIDPAHPFNKRLASPGIENKNDLKLILFDNNGEEIISYQPDEKEELVPLPDPVTPPGKPGDIGTIEELYLTGLRIKQFHNARIDPIPYFREGLSRDPLDSRCNNQMGLYFKNNGVYDSAKFHLRKAIYRLTNNYTRPRNCESLYHLGCILQHEKDYEAAFDTLYRAAWDYEFRAASYYRLAQIDMNLKNPANALELVESSLAVNHLNPRAMNLKTSILRHLGRNEEALKIAEHVLDIDKLNFQAMYELMMISKDRGNEPEADNYKKKLFEIMRDDPETYLELATVYMNSGMLKEASELLSMVRETNNPQLVNYPTIHYYLGYFDHLMKNTESASSHFKKAARLSIDYCFPFRLETLNVYEVALEYTPQSANIFYYRGNILFDKQPEAAIKNWEKAVELNPGFAMAWRNMGWGYDYHYDDIDRAINAYEKAIESNKTEAKFYYELDKLYEEKGVPVDTRLTLLTENHKYVSRRQDALVREILVLVHAGLYDRAIQYLNDNFFHSQEGLRELHDVHVNAHLLRGLKYIHENNNQQALDDFLAADKYPENHQLGRDPDYERNPQIYYFIGLGYEKKGDSDSAEDYYEKAAELSGIPVEYQFYQARALEKLGRKEKAEEIFLNLTKEGKKRLEQGDEVDFFAKFGEEQTPEERKSVAWQLQGLGYSGLNKKKQAREMFSNALSLNSYQIWSEEYLENPESLYY